MLELVEVWSNKYGQQDVVSVSRFFDKETKEMAEGVFLRTYGDGTLELVTKRLSVNLSFLSTSSALQFVAENIEELDPEWSGNICA